MLSAEERYKTVTDSNKHDTANLLLIKSTDSSIISQLSSQYSNIKFVPAKSQVSPRSVLKKRFSTFDLFAADFMMFIILLLLCPQIKGSSNKSFVTQLFTFIVPYLVSCFSFTEIIK